MELNYGLWLLFTYFPIKLPQNTGMSSSKTDEKKTKYIKPHFTYCLHYKLALGAREDMMCGMFHFMTFQSGAFCFDAMQIFILQPTEGNPNRHSYELRCYSSRTFLKLLYFNHGTIVMWKLSASAFSRHSTIYKYIK